MRFAGLHPTNPQRGHAGQTTRRRSILGPIRWLQMAKLRAARPLAWRSPWPERFEVNWQAEASDRSGWVLIAQTFDPEWAGVWVGPGGETHSATVLPAVEGLQAVRVEGFAAGSVDATARIWGKGRAVGSGDLGGGVVGVAWDGIIACQARAATIYRGGKGIVKTGVAIVGASGYGSRELIRILLNHPGAEVRVATSRSGDAPSVAAMHPSLRGRIDLKSELFDADRIAAVASVAFLGLPHTASLAVTPDLRARGVRVIDLSADYRLKSAQVYREWYGHDHTDPTGLASAVYGLPELFRAQIPDANLIANPGCYTSTAILALAPLIATDRIERTGIIVDAYSGISGAGRAAKANLHFPEANENLVAYGVGNHRHTPEIDQVLTDVSRAAHASRPAVEVIFTPHLAPIDRGIHASIYATPLRPETPADLLDLYRAFYAASPLCPGGRPAAGDQGLGVVELHRHSRDGGPGAGGDSRLSRQLDQGGERGRRAELQPDHGLARDDGFALIGTRPAKSSDIALFARHPFIIGALISPP